MRHWRIVDLSEVVENADLNLLAKYTTGSEQETAPEEDAPERIYDASDSLPIRSGGANRMP
jgi:hypothetical protein